MTKKNVVAVDVASVVESIVGVKLTVRGWRGASTAKDVAREVEAVKQADKGTVGATVFYLPDDIEHEIGMRKSKLQSLFNSRTLPFEDGGWRIVMATQFMGLMEDVQPLKDDYEQYVTRNVVDQRDALEAIARKRLGALFREFPTEDTLRAKFRVDWSHKTIATADDVRVKGLTDAAAAIVRESVTKQINEQVIGAVSDITGRLRWLTEDMIGRLEKPDQKRTRYGGLIANVREVCQSLRGLNITGDPRIDKVIVEVEKSLTAYNPESLRDGGWAAQALTQKAKNLLADLDSFSVEVN